MCPNDLQMSNDNNPLRSILHQVLDRHQLILYRTMASSFLLGLIVTISFYGTCYGASHCGVSAVENFRVVDGWEARRGSQPWMVSLERRRYVPGQWRHECAGSILNRDWILTAAHCFIDENSIHNWRVIGGEHDKNVHEESEQIIEPEKIIIHSDFDHTSKYYSANDIALIKLSKRIRVDSTFSRRICIAGRQQTFEADTPCVVAGWGATQGTSHTPNSESKLQIYNSTIVPMAECNVTAQQNFERVTDEMICIRTNYNFEENRSSGGTCRGDSGGPLMCKVGDYYYLAGLTSWSITQSCGRNHDVFTSVQKYRDWITETMKT